MVGTVYVITFRDYLKGMAITDFETVGSAKMFINSVEDPAVSTILVENDCDLRSPHMPGSTRREIFNLICDEAYEFTAPNAPTAEQLFNRIESFVRE